MLAAFISLNTPREAEDKGLIWEDPASKNIWFNPGDPFDPVPGFRAVCHRRAEWIVFDAILIASPFLASFLISWIIPVSVMALLQLQPSLNLLRSHSATYEFPTTELARKRRGVKAAQQEEGQDQGLVRQRNPRTRCSRLGASSTLLFMSKLYCQTLASSGAPQGTSCEYAWSLPLGARSRTNLSFLLNR
jgi:hypothetical protein